MSRRRWSTPAIEPLPLIMITAEDGEGFRGSGGMAVKHRTPGASLLETALHFDLHGRPVSPDNVVGSDITQRSWKRTKRDRVEKLLRALYPNGVPPRDTLRNADLIKEARLKGGLELFSASNKTILRAAGRLPK
jgi:hypothetical protein